MMASTSPKFLLNWLLLMKSITQTIKKAAVAQKSRERYTKKKTGCVETARHNRNTGIDLLRFMDRFIYHVFTK
jgi:hypothetical protein